MWDEVARKTAVRMIKHNEDVARTPGVDRVPAIYLVDEYGRRTQYRGPRDAGKLIDFLQMPYPIIS